MARTKPPPGESDRALWQAVMQGVKPLRRVARHAKTTPPESVPPPPKPGAAAARIGAAPPTLPPLTPGIAAGIDKRSFARFKRGRMTIEARLDLHGLTQDEAHRALTRFIARAIADEMRLLLIITGKGRLGQGVLRDAVPRWLNEPGARPHILALAPAQIGDGGSGALYVLLRRRRERA